MPPGSPCASSATRRSTDPKKLKAGADAPAFTARTLRSYVLACGELQLAFLVCVDHHVVSMQHLALEDLHRERILHHALNRPLQRPRSVYRIVAGLEDRLPRRLSQFQRDAPIFKQPP